MNHIKLFDFITFNVIAGHFLIIVFVKKYRKFYFEHFWVLTAFPDKLGRSTGYT